MWQVVDGEEHAHFEYTPCIEIIDDFVATEQEANPTTITEVKLNLKLWFMMYLYVLPTSTSNSLKHCDRVPTTTLHL
jgi:hypothetical protein